MPIPVVAAAVGGGIAAVGSLIGQLIAGGQEEQAREELRKALAKFGDIALPDLQQAIAQEVGESDAGRITADAGLKDAQMSALGKLKSVSDSGGLMLEDRAALNTIGNRLARQESAGRASITENMAARGIGGGGAELAMQLQNQQGSAARANEAGMDLAGKAQRRALEAIMARGRMAGDMRGQEFGERFRTAQARDELNRYNASARERAQRYNLGLAQQQFDNKYKLAAGQAGLHQNLAQSRRQDAQNTRNTATALGQAGAQGAMAYGEYKAGQRPPDPNPNDTLPLDEDDWGNPYGGY